MKALGLINGLILFCSGLILGSATAGEPTVVIVVGAPGTPDYGDRFAQWADRWKLAAEKGGAKHLRIGNAEPGDENDRQRLEALFGAEPKESAEPFWLVLIGHGTFDGRAAKFNLRGPDVSAADLAKWLEPFKRPLVVIDCASASGPFINRLAGPNRVVLTATKSGYEQNYARFGDYLSTAIADPDADLDKDHETSLLEAFLSASGRVAEFYEQEARLATETALIDDNGDALGTPAGWFRGIRAIRRAKDDVAPDGSLAGQLHLIRSRVEQQMPPEVRTRRDELERAVAELRDARTEKTNEDEHYARIDPLLVALARLYAALERSDDPSDSTPSSP